MQNPDPPSAFATRRRPVGAMDAVLGLIGVAVIGSTLFAVKLWARITRTAYLDD